ncbi:hypothetical protein AB6735_15490 [Mucilaginibacter sp. RCC_168]|jgi:hypothetical protein|uniref:hypothetical protein n=1 Tax=Mucilaginibacter sp. RCC_168 TaxID=3239221 RepID=UPI00352412DB
MAPLIIFSISLLVYYSLRLYKRYNFRKHQLQLYALRDELRQLAIDKKVSTTDWVFNYLDSSISKSVHNFGTINIWYAMYLSKIHHLDNRYVDFKSNLEISLGRSPDLKLINSKYSKIIAEYIWHRHALSFFVIHLGLTSVLNSFSFFSKNMKKVSMSIKNLTTLPETSTSESFLNKANLC